MSIREASQVFGLHRDTVRKMVAYSVPPGYRRHSPPHRPKPESTEGRPWGQPLKKLLGAPLNLG